MTRAQGTEGSRSARVAFNPGEILANPCSTCATNCGALNLLKSIVWEQIGEWLQGWQRGPRLLLEFQRSRGGGVDAILLHSKQMRPELAHVPGVSACSPSVLSLPVLLAAHG